MVDSGKYSFTTGLFAVLVFISPYRYTVIWISL